MALKALNSWKGTGGTLTDFCMKAFNQNDKQNWPILPRQYLLLLNLSVPEDQGHDLRPGVGVWYSS